MCNIYEELILPALEKKNEDLHLTGLTYSFMKIPTHDFFSGHKYVFFFTFTRPFHHISLTYIQVPAPVNCSSTHALIHLAPPIIFLSARTSPLHGPNSLHSLRQIRLHVRLLDCPDTIMVVGELYYIQGQILLHLGPKVITLRTFITFRAKFCYIQDLYYIQGHLVLHLRLQQYLQIIFVNQ